MRRSIASRAGAGFALAFVLLPASHGASPASASCAAGIVRGGHFYRAYETSGWDVGRLGEAVRRVTVTLPACNDSDAPPEPDVKTKMYRYAAAPASVMVSPDPRHPATVYLRPDSFPILAGHPLHAAIHGIITTPDRRRGRCRAVVPRTGRVTDVLPWDGFGLRLSGGRPVAYAMDGATRLRTHEVDGVPRLRAGDRVRVQALRCRGLRPVAVVVRGR